MDPNTARHVLRIDPFSPLTLAMVEASYAREVWERHPSRYPDAEGRNADAWALTLAAARATLVGGGAGTPPAAMLPPLTTTRTNVLVASIPGSDAWPPPTVPRATDASARASPNSAPPPTVAPTPRRLSAGAVLGIVGGALALLVVICGVGFGAAALSQRLAEIAPVDAGAPVETAEVADVQRYSAEEAGFSFQAGLEQYYDGRLGGCPEKYVMGCWQVAVLPESACGLLEIHYSFSNEIASSEESRSTYRTDVAAGDVVELVFGNDDYEYGWVSDVACIENPGPPPTT